MLSSDQFQKFADHFHIGRVSGLIDLEFCISIQTNQGDFFIFELKPGFEGSTSSYKKRIERKYGSLRRLSLDSTRGSTARKSFSIHHQGKYYSVYKRVELENNKGWYKILQKQFDNQVKRLNGRHEYFIVHTYVGYEEKVKFHMEERVRKMHLKRMVKSILPLKDLFPGYIIIKMVLSTKSWYCVRNTPGITGFIGDHTTPIPLTSQEVKGILG